MPRLFADLAIAHGDARYARLLRSIVITHAHFDRVRAAAPAGACCFKR